MTTCPTCGSSVETAHSDEETGCYVPVDVAGLREHAARASAAADRWCLEAHAQEAEAMRLRAELDHLREQHTVDHAEGLRLHDALHLEIGRREAAEWERDRLRAALRSLEWAWLNAGCLYCRAAAPGPHEEGCVWVALMEERP